MNDILNKKMELLTKTFNEYTAKQEEVKKILEQKQAEWQALEQEKLRLQGEYRGLQSFQAEMSEKKEPADKASVKTSEL